MIIIDMIWWYKIELDWDTVLKMFGQCKLINKDAKIISKV